MTSDIGVRGLTSLMVDPARTLLFDLDGVLIDSTPAVVRHWQLFAREHELDETSVLARVHGRRTIDSVRELLAGRDESVIDDAANRHDERELADTDDIVPLPGAARLLAALEPSSWAVVTSAPDELARARLSAARLPWPDVLVSGEDVAAGKPDPEGYRRAAELLDAPSQRCIVFEDAPAGITAGRAAGASIVALATTHSPAELRAAAGWLEHIVPDLSHVSIESVDDGRRRHV